MKAIIEVEKDDGFGNYKKGDIGVIDGYVYDNGRPYPVVLKLSTGHLTIMKAPIRVLRYADKDEINKLLVQQ